MIKQLNEVKGIKQPREVKENMDLVINSGKDPMPLPYEDTGICTEAADKVADIVRSGRTSYWGGGPVAKKLEERFAHVIGKNGAFFHNSGSAALVTGLRALDLNEGDKVAISSSGFISSLNAVYHSKTRPVFIPTDRKTLMSHYPEGYKVPEDIKVALITHFFGNVVDIDHIMEKTQAKYLLEDASQALGSKLDGTYVGFRGDVSTFAGSNRKLFGAGQGGMNVYDDPEIGTRMRTIGHHGKSDNVWSVTPGYNFRGGEMEAVLGHASLDVMQEKIILRNKSADRFSSILKEAGIEVAEPHKHLDCEVVWFDTAVILPENWTKDDRDWLVEALNLEGVPAWVYPSLIETPWVKTWMEKENWWGEEEEALLKSEKELWDRVFVVGTQMSEEDSARCAEKVCELLTK
jgi:dTDP-4-amino-4,6-dideoxygalactose transaminase